VLLALKKIEELLAYFSAGFHLVFTLIILVKYVFLIIFYSESETT
jgi:hypothetical protein